jgi:hypothetical protein
VTGETGCAGLVVDTVRDHRWGPFGITGVLVIVIFFFIGHCRENQCKQESK